MRSQAVASIVLSLMLCMPSSGNAFEPPRQCAGVNEGEPSFVEACATRLREFEAELARLEPLQERRLVDRMTSTHAPADVRRAVERLRSLNALWRAWRDAQCDHDAAPYSPRFDVQQAAWCKYAQAGERVDRIRMGLTLPPFGR